MDVRPYLAFLVLAACGGGGGDELGEATATLCPDDSTLTYADDIAPIMSMYCTTCHATTVPAAQRNGAPTDHNFDSEVGILKEAMHVDQAAGSNGMVTNTDMPPKGYPAPSVEQRMTLSTWLACEAPPNTVHKD